jgi:hypothetical protein
MVKLRKKLPPAMIADGIKLLEGNVVIVQLDRRRATIVNGG